MWHVNGLHHQNDDLDVTIVTMPSSSRERNNEEKLMTAPNDLQLWKKKKFWRVRYYMSTRSLTDDSSNARSGNDSTSCFMSKM